MRFMTLESKLKASFENETHVDQLATSRHALLRGWFREHGLETRRRYCRRNGFEYDVFLWGKWLNFTLTNDPLKNGGWSHGIHFWDLSRNREWFTTYRLTEDLCMILVRVSRLEAAHGFRPRAHR